MSVSMVTCRRVPTCATSVPPSFSGLAALCVPGTETRCSPYAACVPHCSCEGQTPTNTEQG